MTDTSDWNSRIIEEFRANKGKVGGQFAGAPLLLLTTTGAKSGRRHTTPVMYLRDGERMLIFASKAGAPTNPAWFHNLMANPVATAEVDDDSFRVRASVLEGKERDRMYEMQATRYPGFREYQEKTTRVIPVVALTKVR